MKCAEEGSCRVLQRAPGVSHLAGSAVGWQEIQTARIAPWRIARKMGSLNDALVASFWYQYKEIDVGVNRCAATPNLSVAFRFGRRASWRLTRGRRKRRSKVDERRSCPIHNGPNAVQRRTPTSPYMEPAAQLSSPRLPGCASSHRAKLCGEQAERHSPLARQLPWCRCARLASIPLAIGTSACPRSGEPLSALTVDVRFLGPPRRFRAVVTSTRRRLD